MPMRNTTIALRAGLLALCLAAGAGRSQFLETTIGVTQPMAVLWNPISNKVYTANGDNTVSIIDGATNQVLVTLPVADNPSLCWNSVANKVYVLCTDANMLEVIDGRADSILAMVPIPNRPAQVAFNAAMNRLYVGCDEDGRVVVVDGSSDTIMRRIPVARFGPAIMLWHPVSNRLFCATPVDTVYVIDCATDEVVAQTGVRNGALWYWCLNPVDQLAYLGGNPGTYAFAPDGDSVVAYVHGYSMGFCVVPFPNKMYLANWHAQDQLAVLDCNTHTVSDSLVVYAGPLVCDIAKGKVYVGYAHSTDSLGVIDARADTLIMTIPCTGTRAAICWNQIDSRVYLAAGNVLYVIRDTSVGIAEVRPGVAQRASAISFLTGQFVWTGRDGGTVVDATGRKVAAVRSGLNDLGRLPTGVYAVVGAGGSPRGRFVKLK